MKGLIRAATHKDDAIASEAIGALGEIRDPAAVDTLLAAIKGTRGIAVRGEATRALGRIGDARAVEPLIAAVDSLFALMVTTMARSLDAADTGEAATIAVYEVLAKETAHALGELRDPRAIEKLTTIAGFLDEKLPGLLETDDAERGAIARGFGTLTDDVRSAVRGAIATIEEGRA